MTTPHDKALTAFTEYFVRNYPGPDTVIFDPKWHAPKLFNAAMKAIQAETEIGSAADLISDWLGEGTEDLPDDTPVRIEIGKRSIISDTLGNLRASLHIPIEAGNGGDGWQPMSTAPLDGKHCLLAVKEGPFVYVVQGSFYRGQWDAVHRENVEPLCWMPNVRVPDAFLPWSPSFSASSTPSNEGEKQP